MKHITSRDNAVFKHLKALSGSTQQRRRAGQSMLDGVHLVAAYLDAGFIPQQCLVSERHLAHPEVAPLLDRVDPQTIILLADPLFSQLTTVVNGVDVMALIDTPEGRLPHVIDADCVILDGIQDAGNVGSILRCAAASGVRDVFMTAGCAFAWSAKTLRAAMGAHFHLNIVEHCTFESVKSRLQVPLLATSSHARQAVFDVRLDTPVGWVFGNEGAGVSDVWLSAVTTPVVIPQPGGMESLNVAAAAAICLFEAVRQRRAR
ncbi:MULTISPECIES: TrmH family RNA methyltransferase [Ralstonia]|uniref:23S rRNA (Guanosine-2'-O-)-methyltransferase RlmB n=1 Tax=Ralstonia mannitolilytica TaxID=105219 RepID=A0AAJ4ZL20_9RALS|nr:MULTISPECIES: RNA methyltransferase [Ralstonia]AJW45226.1 RNA methyltransferase [Ralstonia mannitolilytica]PLT19123.1 RNA methyltransferase [Ralstonia mannitolilytica]QIF07408.1 RNA methyltransferase [Ralstonia mannitolilytica]CAG2139429.1 23S rRNA (uridine(2479)-2'-O)-methyltransferase [Ralstonia mannitolilytica]CAJ0724669.1 23S rRNA (uridine(2479)-2'-O)-methyltransferase [Ralstonia mannitolilytica]